MKRILLALAAGLAACQAPQTRIVEASAPETSVRPGVNTSFLDPALDLAAFTERFEGESREIAQARVAIADAIGLRKGMAVADVGAGTGLFLELLAERVGPRGTVYELDIARPFVQHLRERAAAAGLRHVKARMCNDHSVGLPRNSIDIAFLCDVYHHFEYPRSTMESIASALKRGGQVVIVDFDRVPGQSRDWVLEHVRAGRAEVIAEMASFGFEAIEEVRVDGLSENYFLRFVKR